MSSDPYASSSSSSAAAAVTATSAMNPFKVAEKKYKYYAGKKTDFSDLIDFCKEDDPRIEKIADGIHKIKGVEGAYHLAGALSKEVQLNWASRCLKSLPNYPNETNLNLHHGRIDNFWDERRDLLKGLRWTTFGYLYQWTERKYFEEKRSPFDPEVSRVAKEIATKVGLDFEPEACIVNYYHHDSTLNGHKDDVEEDKESPIVTISIGCSAVFLLGGLTRDTEPVGMILNGGDVVVMSGSCRQAVHGVPRIIDNSWMSEAQQELDEEMRDVIEYLKHNRINLSVRQVYLHPQQ